MIRGVIGSICLISLPGCLGSVSSIGSATANFAALKSEILARESNQYSQKATHLSPHGGNFRMPRIESVSMDLPYAPNSAGGKFVGSVIAANYNVGGAYPQPSGLTVVWYGTIDFELGCNSVTFDQDKLAARIIAGKLDKTQAYSILFYDLKNNLLLTVPLGVPPKNGTFTFMTPFEDGFTTAPCGANIEIAY